MGLNNNSGTLYLVKQISCNFVTITNYGTDYIGVNANTSNDANGNYTMNVMYGTFTGVHHVFTEDELLIKMKHKILKMIM